MEYITPLKPFQVFSAIALGFRLVLSEVVECDDITNANGWLRCKDDSTRCVSDAALCDGVRDCDGKTLYWVRVMLLVGGSHSICDRKCAEDLNKWRSLNSRSR